MLCWLRWEAKSSFQNLQKQRIYIGSLQRISADAYRRIKITIPVIAPQPQDVLSVRETAKKQKDTPRLPSFLLLVAEQHFKLSDVSQ